MKPELPVRWLGRVGYQAAIDQQEQMRARILAGDASAAGVLLMEHAPVITLGRRAVAAHVVAPGDVPVVRVTRGGDVTYHGPGQLMVYPVMRVRSGVVAFLETVAGALGELASELGAPGALWRRDPAGLWVGQRKLAACGIHLRRSVSVHGWALNVATPPEAWDRIVPCGLRGTGVVSVGELAGSPPPPIAEVAARAVPYLRQALAACQ